MSAGSPQANLINQLIGQPSPSLGLTAQAPDLPQGVLSGAPSNTGALRFLEGQFDMSDLMTGGGSFSPNAHILPPNRGGGGISGGLLRLR